MVVACNAASTVLETLEAAGALDVPVLGMIAPALALVPATFRGTLGVLGGQRTIRSQVYRRGLEKPNARLIDPADGVVAQLLASWPPPGGKYADRVLTTGDARFTRMAAARAWGFDLGQCTHVRSA